MNYIYYLVVFFYFSFYFIDDLFIYYLYVFFNWIISELVQLGPGKQISTYHIFGYYHFYKLQERAPGPRWPNHSNLNYNILKAYTFHFLNAKPTYLFHFYPLIWGILKVIPLNENESHSRRLANRVCLSSGHTIKFKKRKYLFPHCVW